MMISSFFEFCEIIIKFIILLNVFILLLLIVRYNHYSCVFFCVGLVFLHLYMMVAVLGIVGVVGILVGILVEVVVGNLGVEEVGNLVKEEDILVKEEEVGNLVEEDILVEDNLVDTLVEDNLVEVFLDLVVVRRAKKMKNGCNSPGVHPQSYPRRYRFRL